MRTEAYKKSFETLGSLYANQTGVSVVFMRIGSIYGPLYYSGFNLPSRMDPIGGDRQPTGTTAAGACLSPTIPPTGRT